MISSDKVIIKWNSKTKKHYVDLGYEYTKMGDCFEVNVNDLTNGSNVDVELICDYCGKKFSQKWYTRVRIRNHGVIDKDCCKDCCELKSKESVESKYGSYSEMYSESNDKRTKTNLERYGEENVFASEYAKEKIVETNLIKYGCKYSQQNPDVRNKTEETCLKKYGVRNYVEVFKGKFIKENSPCWKGGAEYSRVERATYEYNDWRNKVFARDFYTCQRCGLKNHVGGCNVIINAHHIRNWRDNIEFRYDVDNGITLCEDCHSEFHSIYGKRFNTQKQLEEFLLGKKIC